MMHVFGFRTSTTSGKHKESNFTPTSPSTPTVTGSNVSGRQLGLVYYNEKGKFRMDLRSRYYSTSERAYQCHFCLHPSALREKIFCGRYLFFVRKEIVTFFINFE